MLISLDWIKEFTDVKTKNPKELGDLITIKTAEVDGVIDQSAAYENIVVGQIIEIHPHPNADKLKVTKTSLGKETVQIVCGGANIKEGMYVAVAKVGAKVRWHGEGDLITLETVKIRGEESHGMICAGSEIGIDDPAAGEKDILDLSSLKPAPGTPIAELLNKTDVVLEFDNKALTHRPDLWGHYGIAREIAAIEGGKLKEFKTDLAIPKSGDSIKVSVEEPELCQRYCGLIIKNVTVQASSPKIKERLLSLGHSIHNNIVDITNYVMLELGQPLHAFDLKEIDGKIIVRKAKKGEEITTLDDKTYKLDQEALLIADDKKALAIAGIIGGKHSGISDSTTDIVLEAATFHHSNVRKTSTKIGVRTEAVQRFEKALDPLLAEKALLRAATLILESCPTATIGGPVTDIDHSNKTPLILDLNTDKTRSKIGIEISNKRITEILESLEFQVKEKAENILSVTVPSFRSTKDVQAEDDLIEEVARIHGYDNIPESLPHLPAKLPMENTDRQKKHEIRKLLSYGLGFNETYNYSFYGATEMEKSLLSEEGHLKLLNFLSADQTHLRTTLVPNLLKTIELNSRYFDDLKIYEIGRTYKEIDSFYPLEEKIIGGCVFSKNAETKTFLEAKGAVEKILKALNIQHIAPAKGIKNSPFAHPQRALTYLSESAQTIAQVFEIHPTVSHNHGFEKNSLSFFILNFTELSKLSAPTRKYKKISKFSDRHFDVSILMDKNTEIEVMEKALYSASPELIKNVNLFDLYEGPNIESDKKAAGFTLTIQAEDRTITDEELAELQKNIVEKVEKAKGKVRSS